MSRMESRSSFACPHCGHLVQAGKRVCPNCGSDEETGWSENSEYAHLDPTFDEKDYAQAAASEFGIPKGKKSGWRDVIVPAVAGVLLLLWLIYTLR